MLKKHEKLAERLGKALDACHEAGLIGGVYDCSFYFWPGDASPDPREAGRKFFETIRQVGGDVIATKMNLDGGAGV